MEASPTLAQQEGLASNGPNVPNVYSEKPPNSETTAEVQNFGGTNEHQKHRLAVVQNDFKEPTKVPAHLSQETPFLQEDLLSASSSKEEMQKKSSPQVNLSERSTETTALEPSAVQKAEAESPRAKSRLDAPSQLDHKQENGEQVMKDNAFSEQRQQEINRNFPPKTSDPTYPPSHGLPVDSMQLSEASSTLPLNRTSGATDPANEGRLNSDLETKKTSLQEEESPLVPSLDDEHLLKSSNQNLNVSMRNSEANPTHTSLEESCVEQPRVQSTVNGDAESFEEKYPASMEMSTEYPLPVTHHDAVEEAEPPLATSYQALGNQHQAGGMMKTPDATPLIDSKGIPTMQESQMPMIRAPQNVRRAEIDTAAPFESVKAAVTMFGERMDWKSLSHPSQMHSVERRAPPDSEHHKAYDDLMHYKDQLALTQASTAGILLELRKVKKLIQSPQRSGDTESLPDKFSEPANLWNITGSPSPDKSNSELVDILAEIENQKEELVTITVSKDEAVQGLENALSSLNSLLKRVDELLAEKKSLDEAVNDAHMALADAEEQVALLKSGKKVESLNSVPSDFIEKKSAEIRSLESKLEEANAMVMTLKQELLSTKKVGSESATDAAETLQKVAEVKCELDQAKSEELNTVGKLATVLEESDEIKTKLEKAIQENTTLQSTVQALALDTETKRKDLENLHEKEHTACATLASLQDELQKVKESLRSALGAETRAVEAKDTLPAAIKKAACEADQAKAAAVASKEEARRARQEIDQAKSATSTAVSRQQAAVKELEAAKVSESMALAELKALTESESQGAEMESAASEGLMGVTISLDEYSALKQAAIEAEDVAAQKVAEVTALVEDAKVSQEKAQSKLEEAVKESEKGREELSKVQRQVDDAQEAKLTAEGELRKWRAEHDLRRKSGVAPLDPKSSAMRQPFRRDSEDEKLDKYSPYEKNDVLLQEKRPVAMDSMGQIMSVEVRDEDRLPRLKSKRRSIMKRLAALVALKKQQ